MMQNFCGYNHHTSRLQTANVENSLKKFKAFCGCISPLKHRKKHDSQEGYFVNDQGAVAQLKIFEIFLQMKCLLGWF